MILRLLRLIPSHVRCDYFFLSTVRYLTSLDDSRSLIKVTISRKFKSGVNTGLVGNLKIIAKLEVADDRAISEGQGGFGVVSKVYTTVEAFNSKLVDEQNKRICSGLPKPAASL